MILNTSYIHFNLKNINNNPKTNYFKVKHNAQNMNH